jgi:hypothetical protein
MEVSFQDVSAPFYAEWGSVAASANTGYAQIIESPEFSLRLWSRHARQHAGIGSQPLATPNSESRLRSTKNGKGLPTRTSGKPYDWTLALDDA